MLCLAEVKSEWKEKNGGIFEEKIGFFKLFGRREREKKYIKMTLGLTIFYLTRLEEIKLLFYVIFKLN